MPDLVEALTLNSEFSGRLLMISFVDVSAYLSTLEMICLHLRPLNSSVLIYLAAAVSDFYISEENLVLFSNFFNSPASKFLNKFRYYPLVIVTMF